MFNNPIADKLQIRKSGSFVGPNVIIGTDSIITAHSVVTRTTNVNSIYSGNPATYVKKRWLK